MGSSNDLATVKQVAKLIGISESFLRHRIMRGEFPGVKRFGRAVRIQLCEVEKHFGVQLTPPETERVDA